ncbi:MAG: cytochrome c [Candidatus Binatia bacterium]
MDSTIRSRTEVFLIGALLSLVAIRADAALTQLAEEGESIFRDQCAACHTIGGGDQPMGPDLEGVTERRSPEWLAEFVRDPAGKISAGDPVALELTERFQGIAMPTLELTDAQLKAVLTYLAVPAEVQHHVAPEPAEGAMASGDAARGEALYTGTVAFAQGGAPCLACHGIAASAAGGAAAASFGPDLTATANKFGTAGVISILRTLPYPSMKPIFANRPLTAQEQADLAAFFAKVDGSPAGRIGGVFAAQVLIALAVFLGVLGGLGRRRLRGVRRSLLERVQERTGARQ